jgi:hypothetical protein
VEVVQQLRGEAGETQVERPVYGMSQNIGEVDRYHHTYLKSE